MLFDIAVSTMTHQLEYDNLVTLIRVFAVPSSDAEIPGVRLVRDNGTTMLMNIQAHLYSANPLTRTLDVPLLPAPPSIGWSNAYPHR